MTENLILLAIQVTLILAMFWIIFILYRHVKNNNINIFKRFFTGFWIGLITDMLDTLGIGSFATTTTFFKMTKLVKDDSKLPGTMNAVHVIPVLVQSLCFILVVKVEPLTLITMGLAAFIGASVGPRITKNWHAPTAQRILGTLLIIAAAFIIIRTVLNPGAGNSEDIHGLHGIWLWVGILFNFIIGILMTMGLGNYAPELIFFSMMGLSPAIAMPVMMLDAAMIMTASTGQFLKNNKINWDGFAGIVIGGVIGVLIAVKFLTSLDINKLKMIVVLIVIYTGATLIYSSFKGKKQPSAH